MMASCVVLPLLDSTSKAMDAQLLPPLPVDVIRSKVISSQLPIRVGAEILTTGESGDAGTAIVELILSV